MSRKWRSSWIIGRNVYWCNSHGIPSGSFSQNSTKNCYVPINPTSVYMFISAYIFKGNEIDISKRNLHSHVHCINIHSSRETTSYGNNLSICQQVKRLKQCDMIYIYICVCVCVCVCACVCESYLAIKKKSSICGSMDEIGGPNAK